MNTLENTCIKLIKKVVDKEVKDAVRNKCLFLCYQPELPDGIKRQQKKNIIKDLNEE